MPPNNPHTKLGPISVRPDQFMLNQLADLAAGGFGTDSDIIRRAVDRMWREEIPAIDAAKVKADNERLRAQLDSLQRLVDGLRARGVIPRSDGDDS